MKKIFLTVLFCAAIGIVFAQEKDNHERDNSCRKFRVQKTKQDPEEKVDHVNSTSIVIHVTVEGKKSTNQIISKQEDSNDEAEAKQEKSSKRKLKGRCDE